MCKLWKLIALFSCDRMLFFPDKDELVCGIQQFWDSVTPNKRIEYRCVFLKTPGDTSGPKSYFMSKLFTDRDSIFVRFGKLSNKILRRQETFRDELDELDKVLKNL